jgi:hypothetical protein
MRDAIHCVLIVRIRNTKYCVSTYSSHIPDPGNAGVGRGNKLSVLCIVPWCADGLTFLLTKY